MTVERRGHEELYLFEAIGNILDQARQVALHVKAQSEEIRQHGDPLDSLPGEQSGGAREIGLPQFEECRFHVPKAASAGQFRSHRTNRLIGGFHARAMGKDDNSGGHALPVT